LPGDVLLVLLNAEAPGVWFSFFIFAGSLFAQSVSQQLYL
jgi:hypothetical protein